MTTQPPTPQLGSQQGPPRSQLRADLSKIVHRINETGNGSVSSTLTNPYYDRFSGARMYEHTDLTGLHRGAQSMREGWGHHLRPEAKASSEDEQHRGDPQWVRARPRSQPAGAAPARPLGYGAVGGLGAFGGSGPTAPPLVALPGGPRQQAAPVPAVAQMLGLPAPPPMLALGPGPTPAQKSRMASRP